MKSFQAQTHYEVLEISVGASPSEIRSAHERLTHLYGDDQVALYGLIDPARAAALRARLDEAVEILTDDELREIYDQEIGLPPRLVAKPAAAPPLPPAPVAPPSAPVLALAPPPAPPKPAAPAQPVVSSAGTGWGGGIAWVTPAAATQPPGPPTAYTYEAPAPRPLTAPMLVVPVPARILAVVPPEPPPEPRQLALDVPVQVASWGTQPTEPAPVEAPLEAAEGPLSAVAQPEVVLPPLVVAAEPSPLPVALAVPEEPERPDPPVPEEPPIPVLADDVQVAIVPARATPREFRLEQRPRPYEIPDGVEINGDLLKQVRLAKGLSLVQVADRTRIGLKHLENVESDRYDALPAAVYLRGILMNLARELGLDALRVSRSYLTFVEAHRSKG